MPRHRTGTRTALPAALLAAGPALALSPALAAGWTVVPVPPAGQNAFVIGVSADSPAGAWAVGTVNRQAGAEPGPLIDHWNGTAWHRAAAPAYPASDKVNLDAISASGTADAWAGGFTLAGGGGEPFPTAAHWNGKAWVIVPPASITIGGQPVSNFIVGLADIGPAVGSDTGPGGQPQTLTLHWNGTAWTRVPSPTVGGASRLVTASAVPGSNDVWAAGYSGIPGSVNPLALRTTG